MITITLIKRYGLELWVVLCDGKPVATAMSEAGAYIRAKHEARKGV